ncbi:Der GTPase-activating protein YihI [Neptunicella sp.]|uniref:Der GTPase-activating protein YihI n=1 Tax=Neptunicella sp. TaxID=2125986 RepID=UPI003F690036
MPKIKKTRKVGQIGVRSVPKAERVRKPKEDRKKKPNGRPAGSRQNVDLDANTGKKNTLGNKDPRLGSKVPVPLIATDKVVNKKVSKVKKYFSPAQELEAIENDPRLEHLLNQLDRNKKLSFDDQQFVDKQLARHKQLCELLGIDDEAEEQSAPEGDLLDQLEQSNLDKFK